MTLSGPDALRSLDEALRDIRREEDEIAKRLAHSAELVTMMRKQEGELLRQLAQVRLDPATQAVVATIAVGAKIGRSPCASPNGELPQLLVGMSTHERKARLRVRFRYCVRRELPWRRFPRPQAIFRESLTPRYQRAARHRACPERQIGSCAEAPELP